MASKFVFAIKNGNMIHINELPLSSRGKSCGAYCPNCGGALIARMGDIRSHYFCHEKNIDCEYNDETGIHMLAKDIISKGKAITLPPIDFKYVIEDKYNPGDDQHVGYWQKVPIIIDEIINDGGSFYIISYSNYRTRLYKKLGDIETDRSHTGCGVKFDSVTSEVRYKGKIIDLIGCKGNASLGIEIKVTHPIDREKKLLLRSHNLATIEIDLSGYMSNDMLDFNIDEFRNMLINTDQNRHWVVIKDEVNKAFEIENKLKEEFSVENLENLTNAKAQKKMEKKRMEELNKLEAINRDRREKLEKDEKDKKEKQINHYDKKLSLYIKGDVEAIQSEYNISLRNELRKQSELLNKMKNSERFYRNYVGEIIDSSMLYFKCSCVTWQAIIFYKLIFCRKIGQSLSLKKIIDLFVEDFEYKNFFDNSFYTSSKNTHFNRPCHHVIRDYMEYLCRIGVLQREPSYDFNLIYLTYYILK